MSSVNGGFGVAAKSVRASADTLLVSSCTHQLAFDADHAIFKFAHEHQTDARREEPLTPSIARDKPEFAQERADLGLVELIHEQIAQERRPRPGGLASLVYHLYVIRFQRKLDFAALRGRLDRP